MSSSLGPSTRASSGRSAGFLDGGFFGWRRRAGAVCSATLSVPSLFLSSLSKLVIVGARNSSWLIAAVLVGVEPVEERLGVGLLDGRQLAAASNSARLIEPSLLVSNLAKAASRSFFMLSSSASAPFFSRALISAGVDLAVLVGVEVGIVGVELVAELDAGDRLGLFGGAAVLRQGDGRDRRQHRGGGRRAMHMRPFEQLAALWRLRALAATAQPAIGQSDPPQDERLDLCGAAGFDRRR